MRIGVLLVTIEALVLLTGCASMTPQTPAPSSVSVPVTSNPLLAQWAGPFGGVPPWDQTSPERFREAMRIALDQRRAEYVAITNDSAPPAFENVIVPMQRAGRSLSRVSVMFSVMTNNVSTPEYQALNREIAPPLRLLFERPAVGRNGYLFTVGGNHSLPLQHSSAITLLGKNSRAGSSSSRAGSLKPPSAPPA